MQLLIKGKPKHSLTPELEQYAQDKFGRLEKFVPPEATMEVVLSDELGPKGGLDKAVRVTVVLPHERNPLHVEEIGPDFYSSIDLAQERVERAVRKSKEKTIALHRRVWGRSQALFSSTISQSAAIPSRVWRTIRRQLSRRGW